VLAWVGVVLAQDAPLAIINRVVKEERTSAANPLPQVNAQLPKFFDDDARRGETFAIYWSAAGHGLPAGTTVMFEYVLETAPEIRAQHIQYDFKVEGPRKAVFTIPEKDFREGGTVKAWRVRILRGRLLAALTSPNWPDVAERK
jgi:phage/plasmid primase-like uncharacterized protein